MTVTAIIVGGVLGSLSTIAYKDWQHRRKLMVEKVIQRLAIAKPSHDARAVGMFHGVFHLGRCAARKVGKDSVKDCDCTKRVGVQ